MHNPLVSIIIPSRDEGKNLKKTLETIYSNTNYPEFEVIVVDDGNESDSKLVKKHFPNTKLIQTHMLGVAGARNIGSHFANGEIYVFLDAHVYPISSDWLDRMVDVLNKDGVGVCGPCIVNFSNVHSKAYGQTLKNYFLEGSWLQKQYDKPYEVPLIGGACFCIKKTVFDDVEGWNRHFKRFGLDDTELSLRCWLSGYRVMIEPNVEVYHVFREKHPYDVSWNEVGWNMLVFGFMHFKEERLNLLISEMETRLGKDLIQNIKSSLSSEVYKDRYKFMTKRKFDDDWFFNKFNINI